MSEMKAAAIIQRCFRRKLMKIRLRKIKLRLIAEQARKANELGLVRTDNRRRFTRIRPAFLEESSSSDSKDSSFADKIQKDGKKESEQNIKKPPIPNFRLNSNVKLFKKSGSTPKIRGNESASIFIRKGKIMLKPGNK